MNIARVCLLCSALGLLGACAVHSAPPSHHQNTQNSSSLHNHKLRPNMQPMLYMERFSFAASVGFRSGELGGASMQSSVLCPRSLLPPPTNPAAPQSVAPQKVLFDAAQSPLASTSTPGSFAGPGQDRLSSLGVWQSLGEHPRWPARASVGAALLGKFGASANCRAGNHLGSRWAYLNIEHEGFDTISARVLPVLGGHSLRKYRGGGHLGTILVHRSNPRRI